ncbi:hypothetical protein XarjCFBP8253_21735 [Xanthomonas arboricola pv. juglandis]|nr:hypothetical protein XarjCFBP8253_21735 [Xanthomonas arboricola pv. juglandis]
MDVVHRSSTVTAPSLLRRRPARERPIAYKSYANVMASPHQPPTITSPFVGACLRATGRYR